MPTSSRGGDRPRGADGLVRPAVHRGDRPATSRCRGTATSRTRSWPRGPSSVGLDGAGRSAVVVGCGLGADAEYVASRGFVTTAFDIAPAAIEEVRRRRPESTVDYRVEDLLALSPDLGGRFDLVVEIFTLQALPDPPRAEAASAVVSLVAPGGRLVAVAFRDDGSAETPRGRRSRSAGASWRRWARGCWSWSGSTSCPVLAGSPSITGRAETTPDARAPPAARRTRPRRWRCRSAATRTSRRTG